MKYFYSIILLFLCLVFRVAAEETRIVAECYINGQPVKLAFDTGTEKTMLFRKTANRLNLSIKKAPDDAVIPSGTVKCDYTEKCNFKLYEKGVEQTVQLPVVDFSGFPGSDIDGLLGWGTVKDMVIVLDPLSHRMQAYDRLKFEQSQWNCLNIVEDINLLIIKVSNEDKKQDLLLFDTGDPSGLTVKNELWQQLTEDKSDSNMTLSARVFPTSLGLVVERRTWIPEIKLGDLALQGIPVSNGFDAYQSLIDMGVDASLGMWGLSCYQWIIDGPAGKIYFKENDLIRIPEMYDYNRLGVVFVPKDIQTGDSLIAHVVENGPGWRAGIRDGDELLKIGALDATQWRTNPKIMPLSQYWQKPAGTETDLILLREGKEVKIKVMLEEIFKDTGDHI